MKPPYHYAPLTISVDDSVEDYLKFPVPRFLLWCIRLLGGWLANGIEWNCGTPSGVELDRADAPVEHQFQVGPNNPRIRAIVDNPGIE